MKKIISLITVLSLVLSLGLVVRADSAYTLEEGSGSSRILTELGMFDKSDFLSEGEYVTRGEAARLIVKMTGVGISDSVYMPFNDVDKGSADYGYIATAYALKYISGVSETEFAPDELITVAQISKIIMSALGYDTLCKASGGYPAGYLKYAGSAGLFEGISLSQSDYITPGAMADIILNGMRAELMVQTSFGDERVYNSYEDRNLLSEIFDIYFVTDVIESDKYTSLYDKAGTDANEINAGGTVYDASSYSGSIPVGCRCDIYYRKSSSGAKRQLISLCAAWGDNTVYTLNSADIIASADTKLEYTDADGKDRKLNISDNAIFMYNGQLASTTENIFDGCDEIILVDNDGNGTCDVIFVRKYTIMQVKSLSKDSFSVYDKLSRQSYCFDNTDEFNTVFYYDGKITDFYEIEKGAVLSVLIPKETSVFYTKHVYITDAYAEGIVDEKDDSRYEVVSSGTSYRVVPELTESIKPGVKYRFCFDITGRIATVQSIDDIKNYAYFKSAKSGAFGEVSVQLFTSAGSWIELSLDSSIRFNGTKINAADIFAQDELFSDGEANGQLVEYTVNKDEKLTSVTTASDVCAIRFTDEEKDYIEKDAFRLSFAASSARFFNSSGTITFGEKAHLNDDAVIMLIPAEGNTKEEFIVTTPDKLTHNINYTGIKLYNSDEYGCSSLVVLYDNSESYKGTTPMVVSRVTTTLTEQGDPVERIYGYSRTTYEAEYDIAEHTSLAAITKEGTPLKAGDVIIPVINADGRIVNFERIHSAGVDSYGASSTNVYTDYATTYGKVLEASGDYMVLDYNADKASFRLYSTSVYVCEPDRSGKYTVRLGSVNDIQPGDDGVIRTYYLRGLVAVVYKK